MKVSIIMPFRNTESWINETIDSILFQSFSDWELICIDDNSTDRSPSIIKQARDKRIHYLKNSNEGIIPALQLGLSKAKGQYVTRMDADDLMPQERLSKMVESLDNSERKTIVTGKVKYFSNEPISEGYQRYEDWLNNRIRNKDHWNHVYRECVIASPNWMARRSELIEDKIFDQLKYPEDYDMVFQWYAKNYTIKTINDTTLHWREHPERTSRNSDVYDQDSFFQLKLNWFVKLNGLQDKSIAIFGAGQKGKITARFLKVHGINFKWYDLQHKNYGDEIHDPGNATEELALICVYPDKLYKLEQFLEQKSYSIGENAWYL